MGARERALPSQTRAVGDPAFEGSHADYLRDHDPEFVSTTVIRDTRARGHGHT